MSATGLLLILSLSPLAQAGGSQDPIQPLIASSPPMNFRQRLLVMRGEKAILDLSKIPRSPPDTQSKLLDFAKRLRDANEATEGRKISDSAELSRARQSSK